ncbi:MULTISPECIES: sensor histidine kinase [Nitrosomonas]|uniref:histidine kinase n=2 Tax=Nitrosomonas eutropha TaxID=916 RepID=A0ABX5M956_9PROT|nr:MULTISPECIES: ATP-binding protein [Nitrosomonas]ABI58666.1 multi-sensor signal transduction histidine kinase [Nitrosomonas eutropha C91]PXV80172.1 nitrogen fixation/metabolism regulation signal transduction histidine kinase [Nitrosomonas eutropha]SCX20700.1 Signal transduction histidine kinase involved in nitrogen fixation and metabolism regulation [Nitrosomonas eutropha]SDW19850.1 Signal transduction histidine kinase involved in nitrogen fixation and metabolism regulation [Nitrosomonas eutr
MKYVIFVVAGLSTIMLFLLASAGANTEFFERHYRWLIVSIVIFLLLLIGIVGFLLGRLRRRLKTGVFGSKLALRLLMVFSLMAILPGALVYGISVQFLGKSIESWFDVKVDRALEGGLTLGQTILDNLLEELQKKARAAAIDLAEPSSFPLTVLNQLLIQSQIQEATLFNQDGKVIAFTGLDDTVLFPEIPNTEAMRRIRMQRDYSAVETLANNTLYLRVLVPVNILSANEDIRVLQVLQRVPQSIAHNAEIVQAGFSDYQELMLSRQGLTRLYSVTLTLALLLALFSALAGAFLISEKLSAPLGSLAEGTRAVAQGDFSRRHQIHSTDEFGILTESFNLMTEQLEAARTIAQQHQQEIENARAYLENILANLSSGVIVFDKVLRIRAVNQSAEQILQIPLTNFEGLTIEECAKQEAGLRLLAGEIRSGFDSEEVGEWQRQVLHFNADKEQVLLLRGSRLPQASGGGVVVFDDITSLLQVQRTVAWGEVARRLAHEIKNPLTPIQLSAERLQHKLISKLDEPDARILKRSTETIVNQVEALKKMVNEFREYARVPEPELYQVDINRLVREILALYQTTDNTENESPLPPITIELAGELAPVRGDPARLRQVIHNLLQNAQDALANIKEAAITVRTRSVNNGIELSVTDNGKGFPEQVKTHVFEPYVTTKPRGTGLGLPIVKKIVDEHGGTVKIQNIQPHGAQVSIILPAFLHNSSHVSSEAAHA